MRFSANSNNGFAMEGRKCRSLVTKHAGFCMGVRRAVDKAMKAAQTQNDIVTIGELVHNPEVIRQLEESGIRAVALPSEATGHTAIIESTASHRIFIGSWTRVA